MTNTIPKGLLKLLVVDTAFQDLLAYIATEPEWPDTPPYVAQPLVNTAIQTLCFTLGYPDVADPANPWFSVGFRIKEGDLIMSYLEAFRQLGLRIGKDWSLKGHEADQVIFNFRAEAIDAVDWAKAREIGAINYKPEADK